MSNLIESRQAVPPGNHDDGPAFGSNMRIGSKVLIPPILRFIRWCKRTQKTLSRRVEYDLILRLHEESRDSFFTTRHQAEPNLLSCIYLKIDIQGKRFVEQLEEVLEKLRNSQANNRLQLAPSALHSRPSKRYLE